MKSALPKVLHSLAGAAMIDHVLNAARALKPDRVVVVVAPGMDAVAKAIAPAEAAVQDRPLGTAHAVRAAEKTLKGFRGDVLIVFGDTPLVRPVTLRALLKARRAGADRAVAVMGFYPPDPGPYGRLIVGSDGTLERIVEAKDASPEQKAVRLCNGGIMAADAPRLFELLREIDNRNAKSEFYLTDLVAVARRRGHDCVAVEGEAEDVVGVNSRAELAAAEAMLQQRLRAAAMAGGATLTDPSSVWFCVDTKLARDVLVEPHVFFGPGVSVAEGARIRAFSHLEGARVGAGAIVGPYARLRPGSRIEAKAKIGNFVEIKDARVDVGAKVNHLSYIGNARVGAKANVGAGTITCNYDGFGKHFTSIGKGAFIGSNTALVAPVKVGAGAIVGAGSVITRNVPGDALAVERAAQKNVAHGASRLRARRAKKNGKE
jgi:bifunctional UDP-N-acetylglucosamine pyrophosphorylase / glucosamine-1-phosphate N-acetyltransferase